VPVLGALAATLLATPVAAPVRAATTPPPAPDRLLSFLHAGPVSGPSHLAQIVDEGGREVLLKGVNVDGLTDYFRTDLRTPYPLDPAAYANGACPSDDPTVEGVVFCTLDLPQMRQLGYDAVRLDLSWSLLEPRPGLIDTVYLDRIAQVVGWLKQQGIYSILDMHQDAWSKYVFTSAGTSCPPPLASIRGFDGAPQWASTHVAPACALLGVREFDAAVQEDFQRLWSDTPAPDGVGLQEHFAAAVTALARRFHFEPAVAGYEIINEPSPGLLPVTAMDPAELFPFYGKVVNTVTAAVPRFRQLFFVEPDAARNLTDARTEFVPWSVYSSYANVVYAPHIYTGVFTLDAELAGAAHTPAVLPPENGYQSAAGDAQALGLPLWIGEYGNPPNEDDTVLRAHYRLQDDHQVGGTLWLWKENANDINAAQAWGVYHPPFGAGTPVPTRIKYTGRAFPLFTAGHLTGFGYDPGSGAFDLRATSPRVATGDQAHATVLFIPPASVGDVRAEGAKVVLVDRGGGAREAYVYPRGGDYHVHLGVMPPAGGGAAPRVGTVPGATVSTPVSLPDTASATTGSAIAALAAGWIGVALGRRRLRR
jgi:endoglycosylceramidase